MCIYSPSNEKHNLKNESESCLTRDVTLTKVYSSNSFRKVFIIRKSKSLNFKISPSPRCRTPREIPAVREEARRRTRGHSHALGRPGPKRRDGWKGLPETCVVGVVLQSFRT